MAERLKAKLSKNYDHADYVKESLARSGVVLHDGCKAWRGDGDLDGFHNELNKAARQTQPMYETAGNNKRNAPVSRSKSGDLYVYTRADDGKDRPDLNEDAVVALVNKRSWLKANGAYEQADVVRLELQMEHRVEVKDKSRTWVALTPHGHPHRPVKGRQSPPPDHPLMNAGGEGGVLSRVESLLATRWKAKLEKQFFHADAAQDALRAIGVEVDDYNFSWRFNNPNAAATPRQPGSRLYQGHQNRGRRDGDRRGGDRRDGDRR